MESEFESMLIAQAQKSAFAYFRNLAAAEAAIPRGQFNLAKVLRAAAHTQRALALGAARLLNSNELADTLLQTNLSELESAPVSADTPPAVRPSLEQFQTAQQHTRDLIQRSLQSLQTHPDVLESDVAQSLWGCYQCGYIVEGAKPDGCPVCGAVGAEFEWFGPFYSATPEHLGQLTPAEVLSVLQSAPEQVAEIIAGTDDATLTRKPSETEWSAKELAGHILETDMLFTRRATAILHGDGELATPTPPWKLHEGKGYQQMPPEAIVERFRQTRRATLAIIRDLNSEEWSRHGRNGVTSTSLLDLGTWLANHDRGHIAQLSRLSGNIHSVR